MRIKPTSVIIVLGQALYRTDNNSISMLPSHESRVETAYDIFSNINDNDTRIILSGGDTKQYNITEAKIMQNKLLKLHQHSNHTDSINDVIVLEEKSINTVENALHCFNIVTSSKEYNNCTIHVISNEYHIPRARCIFKCVFNNNPYKCYKMCYHCADSRLNKTGKYRQKDKRGKDENPDIDWLLSERMDWEENALVTLNDYLHKYNLNCTTADIYDAINDLRRLNETLK